jgi:hypothetical protein
LAGFCLRIVIEKQMRGRNRSNRLNYQYFMLVGAEGFEPPTLCSQSRCATRLRYAPTCFFDCTVNRNPEPRVEEQELEWARIKRDQGCCTSVLLSASDFDTKNRRRCTKQDKA